MMFLPCNSSALLIALSNHVSLTCDSGYSSLVLDNAPVAVLLPVLLANLAA
jgi:hypothetical protein